MLFLYNCIYTPVVVIVVVFSIVVASNEVVTTVVTSLVVDGVPLVVGGPVVETILVVLSVVCGEAEWEVCIKILKEFVIFIHRKSTLTKKDNLT